MFVDTMKYGMFRLNTIVECLFLILLLACADRRQELEFIPYQNKANDKWGFMAADGSVAMKAQYTSCPSAVVNGRYCVQNDEGFWKLYSFDTREPVCNRQFRSIGYFWEDVTPAVESDMLEIIDKKGDVVAVLSPKVLSAHNYCEGKACVQLKDGGYGFVDTQGRLAPFTFDYASDFSGGVAVAGNYDTNGKMRYMVIDKSGRAKSFLDVKGVRILEHFHDGYLLYQDLATNAYGLMNEKGQRMEMDASLVEQMNQLRNGSPTFGKAGADHLAIVVYDDYMNGRMVQHFSAELPRNIEANLSVDRLTANDAVISENRQMRENQDSTHLIQSRLNEALKCMATNVKQASIDRTDPAFRKVIGNYVECVRVAYEEKNLPFLQQVFSDDALIIVGRVIKSKESMEGYLSHKQVEYNIRNKQEYLQKLAVVFKTNRSIRLAFSQVKIVRHPTKEGFYGVTLKQGYRSDFYSDEGYLFMLWDFRNPEMPQIHVRTWQPSMLDSTHPLDEKAVFKLGDFTLE